MHTWEQNYIHLYILEKIRTFWHIRPKTSASALIGQLFYLHRRYTQPERLR